MSPKQERQLAREIRERAYSGVYANLPCGGRVRIVNARFSNNELLLKTIAGEWFHRSELESIDY